MAFSCTMYCNTGFNSINIPDSPELLESSASKVISGTALDLQIVQDRFLNSIRVKTTWSEIQNCDYVRVDDFFYSVVGIQMVSVQVAELYLVPDFLLSAGGTKNPKFSILDGITERQTVSDDTWGKYTDTDPLTSPQQPLNVVTQWATPDKGDGYDILLEATTDLVKSAAQKRGVTYTDDETNETVTVPMTQPLGITTQVFMPDGNQISNGTQFYKINDAHTETAPGGKTDSSTIGSAYTSIQEGIKTVRSLGIESGAIINQWRVPKVYISDEKIGYSTVPNSTYFGALADPEEATTEDFKELPYYTNQQMTAIYCSKGDVQTTINSGYATVKNNRVLYGEYNKYGIITTAGNSCEFNPEDIMSASGSPTVSYKADVRPDGRPYFRFKRINNNEEFWRNCVAGERWENVPLIYQGGSGSALNRINFDNKRRMESEIYGYGQGKQSYQGLKIAEQGVQNTLDLAGSAGNYYSAQKGIEAFRYGPKNSPQMNQLEGMQSDAISSFFHGIVKAFDNLADIFDHRNDKQFLTQAYNIQKANELSELYQANTVYVPNVIFPYNASVIRDSVGNGFLLYKYQYRNNDIKRIDRLLTMYGYREQESLSTSNFNRRTKFDYVQCSTITVTGRPTWWNNGISAQLSAGVRVWHVKPTPTAYSDNPIATT